MAGFPPRSKIVDQPAFQQYLDEQPLFARFVELAASDNQVPIPVIRGAGFYNREIRLAGEEAMADESASAQQLLEGVRERVRRQRHERED